MALPALWPCMVDCWTGKVIVIDDKWLKYYLNWMVTESSSCNSCNNYTIICFWVLTPSPDLIKIFNHADIPVGYCVQRHELVLKIFLAFKSWIMNKIQFSRLIPWHKLQHLFWWAAMRENTLVMSHYDPFIVLILLGVDHFMLPMIISTKRQFPFPP